LVGHREIVGKGLSQVLPEVIAQGFLEILDRVYSTSTPFVGRALPILLQRVPEGDLEQRYIDLIYQPMLDDEENVTGIFVQGNDVTEAFILAQEVAHQAAHDFLTGLPNRREFARRMQELSWPGPHAVLYLDIDHFKLINDRCGHAAGDSLLLQVADLLRSHCVSSGDILARLGGDEFAIVRQNCSPGAATEFGNRLRVAIKELRLVWEGKHYGVTLSVGIASFGGATGLSFETALSLADAASFIAKEAGRNRVQVSLPSDEDIRRQQTDLDSITRLTEAMLQDRVVLHVQRIVDLHDDSGLDRSIFEVLARIRDPMGGILGPAGFIPAAERFGLIEDLDRHIITKVFSYIQAQPPSAALRRTYFINISGITLSASGFPCFIREALLAHPLVCAAGICFEITETAALSHIERTVDAMLSLTSLGFKFALDDFGSGMASFGYLNKLPVQYIKIDGEFIRTVFDQRVSFIIVEAITKVAHAMNMKVIAESVERPEMISHLKALGVDFGQGFALHRPENM
ncbi:putative bifunctional diguanylate cyclase/phosphodiesterase, partial [Cereibacter changlensis]